MKDEKRLLAETIFLSKQDIVELYEQFSPYLYRYAVRLLGDVDLAEDCVSDTFSRYLQSLSKGGGPRENLRAYLYRTAHNWVIDHFRRNSKEAVSIQAIDMVDPIDSPANQLSIDQEREKVRKALLRLPIDQQQVIMLRFLDDLPHEQVAEIMGRTIEATRALQYRALSALRSILKDEDGVTDEH